jgi:hypothetical protein
VTVPGRDHLGGYPGRAHPRDIRSANSSTRRASGLKGGILKRLVNPGPSCSAYSPRRPLNVRKSSRKRRLVCVSGHVE